MMCATISSCSKPETGFCGMKTKGESMHKYARSKIFGISRVIAIFFASELLLGLPAAASGAELVRRAQLPMPIHVGCQIFQNSKNDGHKSPPSQCSV